MNRYMEMALIEARKGVEKKHGGPFGCVIVRNDKVVCMSHNTVLSKHDATCHAEMNAIRLASKKLKRFDLSDCEVYTTGKPCPMCRAALNWAKVKTVYYACNYKDAEIIGFKEEDGNNEGYKEIEIDREECLAFYENYKNKFETY
jgi:guanine deaminase